MDLDTFVIAGPAVGTTTDWLSTMDNEVYAGAIGDCVTDTFTVTSPGSVAPPLICGFNSGQHCKLEIQLLRIMKQINSSLNCSDC